MSWIWWAPLGAAVLHIVEEFVWPGGFADWDRQYRPEFARSITSRFHLVINALLLVLCAMVAIAGLPEWRLNVAGLGFRSAIPQTLAVPAWLALMALLFSNAIFHAVGTYRTGRQSPGLRTAVLLYVPLTLFGFWHFLHDREVSPAAAVLAALAGGSYHLWASLAHRRRARPA